MKIFFNKNALVGSKSALRESQCSEFEQFETDSIIELSAQFSLLWINYYLLHATVLFHRIHEDKPDLFSRFARFFASFQQLGRLLVHILCVLRGKEGLIKGCSLGKCIQHYCLNKMPWLKLHLTWNYIINQINNFNRLQKASEPGVTTSFKSGRRSSLSFLGNERLKLNGDAQFKVKSFSC